MVEREQIRHSEIEGAHKGDALLMINNDAIENWNFIPLDPIKPQQKRSPIVLPDRRILLPIQTAIFITADENRLLAQFVRRRQDDVNRRFVDVAVGGIPNWRQTHDRNVYAMSGGQKGTLYSSNPHTTLESFSFVYSLLR